MKGLNLKTLPSNDLWQLYERVGRLLTKQLTSDKHKLEQRLSRLRTAHASSEERRRPYLKVHPRKSRWISEQPTAGKSIDDLRIDANET
jgi:hypothetical protein